MQPQARPDYYRQAKLRSMGTMARQHETVACTVGSRVVAAALRPPFLCPVLSCPVLSCPSGQMVRLRILLAVIDVEVDVLRMVSMWSPYSSLV
jgi:hypothetical protein